MKPIILVIVLAACTMYITLHNTNSNNAKNTATIDLHQKTDTQRPTKQAQTAKDDLRINYLLW